ncbi:MAG TPA: hypothetical protein VH796_03495 [Nitrososphaeraceae archaeon]
MIWVELDIPPPYDFDRIMAYRLDDGTVGMLKGSALKKAQKIIDLYNYSSGIGIYQELEIDERDFIPIDLDADKSLQVEN